MVSHKFLRTEWRVLGLLVGRATFDISEVENVYANGDEKHVLWIDSKGKSKRILLMPYGSSVERPVKIIRYYLVRDS